MRIGLPSAWQYNTPMKSYRLFLLLGSATLSACATPIDVGAVNTQANRVKATAMVVTANPHASKTGADILRAGGSAVDAAIAIEAVLSLVEPQSSGLGGGGFMTYYNVSAKQIEIYDGRETAPAGAKPDMFVDKDGNTFGYILAKNSGLSTGVPGIVSMLQMAHADHGKLAWGEHFTTAITLANDGFPISPRLQNFLVRFSRFIPKTAEEGPSDAYHYFYDESGDAHPVGHLLKNPAYAKTLDILAKDASAFYKGSIADEIIAQTSQSPRAGSLNKSDLESYSAQKRVGLCSAYRDMQVCGPPPPSSWLAVAMTLGILQHGPAFSADGAEDPKNWAILAEAQRLAYADRDHFVGDPEFAEVPVAGMLDPQYLAKRAGMIDVKQAKATIEHGDPWAFQPEEQKVAGRDATNDVAGTSHFVVVDFDGNVVSMTASVESIFGSTRMAGGMFLNNQLTDFSFRARDGNDLPIANAIAPGKRPRSSMSPTIVLDKNRNFLLASGSPGGNSIIAYTVKSLVGVLDWGLDPQAATALPNLVARGQTVKIEQERASPELISGVRAYGHQVKESAGENSGLSVVYRNSEGVLVGGVDPRREGTIEVVTR